MLLRTDPAHAGALGPGQSSWPLVQETLNAIDCSYQQAQGALIAHGYPVGPTDRLPAAVVLDVMEAEGYVREHLRRV